ncbi:PRC-barrel domain-containing protein [Roseovarius sp. M141]|uniref:PRC-barrel domain-containing protein n=1 Tax=Roseovarius sp. M141 TaxID=2583806 RepID=UPI0020CEF2D7|nr:PRC-barrel domain-containing protein [Roseovarius sp. M141]MCQ0094006.1 PRC-barrel domain containing protein [Roseovarius sp. M141]
MKTLLSTTALVIAMTGAVSAETSATGFGQVEMQQSDFYASKLIGMRIYNAENAVEADATIADGGEVEWDDIGEINDIIVTQDGTVSAVILGVGGFLGIGERDVAVPMDEITVVREEGDSDDRFLVVSTTKEALEQMPAFERGDDMAEAEMVADDDVAVNDTAQMTNEGAQRELLPRPAVEREGYAEVEMSQVTEMTSEQLEGAVVYGANDESVGEVDSLVLGDDGKVSHVVINVGGFLGLGEKPVAVTFDELQILQQQDGDDVRIYIDSTQELLEAQPEYEM